MECGKKTKWIELLLEGCVHTWTACYFGPEAFPKETPFNLVLVEFAGINMLLLARLIGITQEEMRVGMKARAQFRRNSRFDPTDVYFVSAEDLRKRERGAWAGVQHRGLLPDSEWQIGWGACCAA